MMFLLNTGTIISRKIFLILKLEGFISDAISSEEVMWEPAGALLFLQIPEVRLNIISNLDCVNQGTTVLLKNITGGGNETCC